jgi:hypothetical protein
VKLRAIASLLALGLCCSGPAFAQAPAKDAPAKDAPAKEPAARDITAKDVTAADKDKSRVAFRKGVAQLRAQDWAGARASFEEAWSFFQHPSILLNLGIARLKTDDPVLAEQDLMRFLGEDSGAGAEELTSARDALVEARSKIGGLRVIVTPAAARLTLDGKPLPTKTPPGTSEAVAETKVKAGGHSLTTEADGFAPDQRSFDVAAKGEAEVKIALAAAPKTAGAATAAKVDARTDAPASPFTTRKIVGYSLAGVSGIALVTSGILGLQAISASSDYENPRSRSYQKEDVKSEGVGYRTGADVALIIALLAGTGAVLLLFTDVGSKYIGAPPSRAQKPPLEPLLRW